MSFAAFVFALGRVGKFKFCLLDFFGGCFLGGIPAAFLQLGEHLVLDLVFFRQQVHKFVHQRWGGTFVCILIVVFGHKFFRGKGIGQHLAVIQRVFLHGWFLLYQLSRLSSLSLWIWCLAAICSQEERSC